MQSYIIKKYFSINKMDDNILKMYIDEVFAVYDKDRSGQLDKNQLVNFFNNLFASMNDPRRVDQNVINQLLGPNDMNKDGQISKPQLFSLFKKVLTGSVNAFGNIPSQQNQYNQYQYSNQNQNGQYPKQNQYGQPQNLYQYVQSPNLNSNGQQQYGYGNGPINQQPYNQMQSPQYNPPQQFGYGQTNTQVGQQNSQWGQPYNQNSNNQPMNNKPVNNQPLGTQQLGYGNQQPPKYY